MERRDFLGTIAAIPLAARVAMEHPDNPTPGLWWEGDKAFVRVTVAEGASAGDIVTQNGEFVGVAHKSIPPGDYGWVQVYGYSSDVLVR